MDALITDFFRENKFNLFVKYCEEHGLKYMEDLRDFDFSTLLNVKYITEAKVRGIEKRYRAYLGVNPVYPDNEGLNDPRFKNINNELEACDIELLGVYDIRKTAIDSLRKQGYITIGDLKDASEGKLRKIMTAGAFQKLMSIESDLEMPLKDLLASRLMEFSQESDYMITLLRAEGYTLQAIASSYHVTRERIRQIVNKFEKKIAPLMQELRKNLISGNGFFSASSIVDYYDDNNMNMILLMWFKDCPELEYLDFADVFVPYQGSKEYHKNRIYDIAVELIGDGADLSNCLEDMENLMFKNGYPFVDEAAFLNLVQSKGYYVYNDYIVKGRQSYGLLCSKIVAKRFPDGVKVYEGEGTDDLNLLRKLAFRTYGDIKISNDDRAFSARLTDYLVLRDRGKYVARESIRVDMSVIRKIKTYIDQSNEKRIYYSALFEMFKHDLMSTGNIDNYNFLHGVLKLYYDDEYDFSSKDYFTRSGKGLSSGKTDDKILQVIENAHAPVGRLVLKMKVPGVSDAMILNAAMYNENLIPWEVNCYYSVRCLDITEDDKVFLDQSIQGVMKLYRGYCSANLLYAEVSEKRPEFINKNRMTDPDNLFYVCAKLFSNSYGFRKPHITSLGLMEEISAKNVVLHLLKDPVQLSYSAYKETAKVLKWSDVTMGAVFDSIEDDYIRVSEDIYVKKDEFDIKPLDIERILFVLRQSMQKQYISLMSFDKWNQLPYIGYEWNPFLLRVIIEKYIPELKIVESRSRTRAYEKGIAVGSESDFIDYTDIVVLTMKQHDKYEMAENELCKLLIDNGLTYKVIPKEIYASDKIKYKDDVFAIKERK